MSVTLVENRYGKSRVRLLKVMRREDRHEIFEATIAIACEGDLAEAYTAGDNRRVLPTDTMKNTVYALAREHTFAEPEELGRLLGRHFLAGNPRLDRVVVTLESRPWSRVAIADRPHPHTFVEAGAERRTAEVAADRTGETVRAGIRDLLVLKTAGSGFEGFPRDRYTTLPEARDRILATRVRATWRYGDGEIGFGNTWEGIRRRLIETFAEHESRSLQHTLYAMGEAVLAAFPEVEEIHLALPNQHYLLADLSPFGLDNENEIFIATDEPHGLIEGTLRR
jgi:urate oxidase